MVVCCQVKKAASEGSCSLVDMENSPNSLLLLVYCSRLRLYASIESMKMLLRVEQPRKGASNLPAKTSIAYLTRLSTLVPLQITSPF
jgi:hypothetical protein